MAVTFKGGIHPQYRKELAADAAIQPLPPPKVAVVHLNQHIGAPAKPLVEKKDRVLVGQLIAEAAGFVSAPVHAPISGVVKDIGPQPHPGGIPQKAVVIEADGEDQWVELPKEARLEDLSPDEVKSRIRDAGIVGLGGAAFPTHVKLSPPANKPIDTVILNGAECEPYLTADDRLLQEEPERVLSGFLAVLKVLGAKEGVLAIEENKPAAISAMEKVTRSSQAPVRVERLQVKYPQGGEKQLIFATLGRQVPSGGLPMDVGVVVQNVATCAAIDDAVRLAKPLLARVTTVTGDGVTTPCNVVGRVGTPLSDFIQAAGGYQGSPGRLILGGPMMGLSVHSDSVPSLKSSGGVLVLPRDQVPPALHEACIRCGRCVRACPMGLCPNEMGAHAEAEMWETVVDELDVKDCIECGSCVFSCPANRPLVQWFRYAKLWDRQRQQQAKKQ